MNPLVSEKKQSLPILIVDKKGLIGESLSEKIFNDTQVVLVTEREIKNEKIILVPYGKKPPIIPQSNYSHIFLIDEENSITREALSSFIEKAKADSSILIIVSSIKTQRELKEDVEGYRYFKLVLVGETVDKNIYKSYVAKILNQAKMRGKVVVPGEGMDLVYPLFFNDLINGILEAAFGTSKDKLYFLFPKHGISLLSFVHLIQKANPDIMVDFGGEENLEAIKIAGDGRYLLEENYPIEDKIRNHKLEISRYKMDGPRTEYENTTEAHSGVTRNIRMSVFFLILFLLLPLITTVAFIFLGIIFLNTGKLGLKSLDMELSGKYIATSQYFLGLSNKTSEILSKETFDLSLSKNLENYSNENYKYSQGFNDFFQAVNLYSKGDVYSANNFFKNFLIFAQRDKASDKKVDFISSDLLNLASGTIETWPRILGFNGRKKYLVIFQNNMILRPQGGSISTYGLLNLNKGKIEDFVLGNSKEADDKLRGHIEPPFAIRRYLGEKNWLFKDSNFKPDFVEAAQDSSYLFSLETEEKPDGVLAADLNFIKRLLVLTGELKINNYGVINETNLVNLSLRNADNTEFLTAVLREVYRNFKTRNLSLLPLFKNLSDDIKHKDVFIAFPQDNIQSAFTLSGLSNSFWDGRSDSKKNINDFLSFSEANFSRASNQIERNIVHTIDIVSDGKLNLSSEIELKNNGEKEYKTYLSFILPQGVVLKGLKINGEDKDFQDAETNPQIYEDKNFKNPNGIEIEKSSSGGKTLFGFYLMAPSQKIESVIIHYSLPDKPIASVNDFSYSFVFLKQPGVDFYPFSLKINYPKDFKALSFPKGVIGSDNSIYFSSDISKDTTINLDFSKK